MEGLPQKRGQYKLSGGVQGVFCSVQLPVEEKSLYLLYLI